MLGLQRARACCLLSARRCAGQGQYCLEHNVLIGVGGSFGSVLRLQPPLVIDEMQLDVVVTTIAAGLEAYGSR